MPTKANRKSTRRSTPTASELAQVVREKPAKRTVAVQSDCAFIIMSFRGDPVVDSYYIEAVKPTIEACGLKPIRVNEEHFRGKITDRILDNIRKARLIIADLTEDSPNCYFEVGVALALRKAVIWQRLAAPAYDRQIPFDVKDYPHILYTTVADLRKRLKERIEGLLADEKRAPRGATRK